MELGDLTGGALELGLFELLRQRLLQTPAVTSPAAGAEWTASPPVGAFWEVLSIRETFATSAVVANRTTGLQVKDPNGNLYVQVPPQATQAASLTASYQWLAGYGDHLTGSAVVQALPDPALYLPAGWSLGSQTANLDVGDQYSGVRLLVREWSLLEVAQAASWYGRKQWPT